MVSKIVSNCQEEPIRYVNLEIPTEKQVEGDVTDEEVIAHTSAPCGIFCSLPLNKEVRDILENLDTTAPSKQKPPSSLLNTKKLRKFLCLYCERTFATGSLRSKHEERCHSAKQARRSSSRFQQSPLKPTICFLCPQNNDPPSLCPNDLFKHLLDTHSDTYFGCYECKERFSSFTHLQTHREEMHSAEELNNGSSASNDLSPSSPPNSLAEDVKLNIEDDEPNKVQLRKRPPRRRKIAFRSAKLGVKRNTRLQAKQTLQKRNVKPLQQMDSSANTTPEKSTSGSSVNSASMSENPYPAFDAYYRVKKITDHSIDNLRISSLTFDDVFDKAFYNRIKCNIRENLMHHIDGKLFKNKESDARISNFEKGNNRPQNTNQPQQQQNPHQVSASAATENYGCELSLNAATPSSSLCTTHQLQAGEDILESQIEYGSKASNGKKKSQSSGQEEVRFKYLTRRKYQASILESKENRDLSRLDMWTQIVVKNRQQRIADDSKSDKERSEYKNGDEYKAKKQNEELNRVLDKRGPFEDLKEEANKQAALEGNYIQEAYIHITSIMEDILAKVFVGASSDEVDSKLSTISIVPTVQVPELPAYLHLQRGSVSQPTYIDKSDKISLICSSQEIEGYNDHDASQSEPNKLVELTGEWARSRLYICSVCGLKVSNMKLLMEHKSIVHLNVWCQHYEFVGNQGELYRHLSIPALGKMGEIETQPTRVMWRRSEARYCSKCSKQCNSLGELHRHILECGEDWAWMMTRKKCKYRPFGAKTRKKRRGLFKRIVPSSTPGEKRIYKKKYHEGPRQKPSDAETIQRMLANLPAKRATRKIMSLKDGFPSHRKSKALSAPTSNKKDTKTSEISANSDEKSARKAKTNPVLRSSVRNVNKVIASKIMDTNSSLLLRRRLRRTIRTVPKSTTQKSDKTDEETAIEKLEFEEETDGQRKQDKISLLERMKLLKKRVVRKIRAKKMTDGCDSSDKRVTRNATVKLDGEELSENSVCKKMALKTDPKLIESSESLTDTLLDNNSIDIIIEIEPTTKQREATEEGTAITPTSDTDKSIKRSPKKRRSNISTGKVAVKKQCLQTNKVPSSATDLSQSNPDINQAEVNSAANLRDFLGTIDPIPKDTAIIARLSSLQVLAAEVLRSDASASVAVSNLVVNPPLEIAVCPKELNANEAVDLTIQHSTDNPQRAIVKTPISKRCKRNKGLNDCIAMLTNKLLLVNEDDNNVSSPTKNRITPNICAPINHNRHNREFNNQDTNVWGYYAHIDALSRVSSGLNKPNILNIPPVLNSNCELAKTKLDDLHRINLPSTIVPIIKIPNYPLKVFSANPADRKVTCKNSEVNLIIPRDLNIYPTDRNKVCDLVAQDLSMPAVKVPICTLPNIASFEPINKEINLNVQKEIAIECVNTTDEKISHVDLLNMSTYEMKTITPSTETIISTAEPEILAGNPLPEEVIQKSQMLPIEAAKCEEQIDENKEDTSKVVLNDLISGNILSLKKCRRPVKSKLTKSRSKPKEIEDISISKCLIENRIEETEKYQSKSRNKDTYQNDVTIILQNNINEDSYIHYKEVQTSKAICVVSQEEEDVVKTTIKNLINTPSDSDDELPLSKLIKSSTTSTTNNLIKQESIVVNVQSTDTAIIFADQKEVVTISSETQLGKQTKKPRGRKRTKQQSKVDELPLTVIKDDFKLCDNPTIDSSVICDKLEAPMNIVIPEAFTKNNAPRMVKKTINRKKGKRKQVDNLSSALDIIDAVLPQIKESTIEPRNCLIEENSKEIQPINLSLICADLNEPLNESLKGFDNREKTRRKNMEIEDEIPLSILLKSSTDVKDILNLDELSSKTKFTIVNVAEAINVQGVDKENALIKTTIGDIMPKGNMVDLHPKLALKQTVNRKKKELREKTTQTKKLISNSKMQDINTVNVECIPINKGNIDTKDEPECQKLGDKIEHIDEPIAIKTDLETDEVDGPTVFTDSSIRTCSIIEATIDSAFRHNTELIDIPTVDEINSHPINSSGVTAEDSGVSITLNGDSETKKQPRKSKIVVENRKSTKKPDRKKKRKKGSKFRRMPKLKAMKAYIDSVSEDTTSKGLDITDEHSISDINLECLLRTNTPSIITDEPPIENPVLADDLATDNNEPISTIISNDLPEVNRSDQSSPIEEFASDCNNSFDGLIRSHEPFDVTRELECLEEPLKLSVTGILDPVETFNKLASEDLEVPKLVETNVEPIEFPVACPKNKSTKIKKRGKGHIAKKSDNTLTFNEVPQNLINETGTIVLEKPKLPSEVPLIGFSKEKEDEAVELPEKLDLPVITIDSSTARKFDSSIYDFDPTSEDLLLDDKSLCKSPNKQKIMHITNKEDATVAEISFSPRRSRSRKSDSNVLQLYSSFNNTHLKSSLQIATEEVAKNDLTVSLSPNVLKEIHDENEINYSPRRSRSRKSETVLVETEVPSNVIETNTTCIEANNSASIKAKARLKPRQGKAKARGRKKSVILDPSVDEKESFCDICNKSFARNENLMKHKRTLTHIAKLSEIEAREAQIKAVNEKILEPIDSKIPEEKDDLESVHMDEEDLNVDQNKYQTIDSNNEVDIFPGAVPVPYSLPPKLADIISDVLSKPVDLNTFDNLQQPISQMKRYKSLGERKSFDSETVGYNNQFPTLLNEEPMPPNIQTADSILKTQISILENIIENKSSYYINEDSCKSTDSKQSNGRCPSDMSLVSDIKQDDSNIISFSQRSNMNIIEPRLTGSFLKPSSHYEEISEDSTVVRKHFEDQKARKVLNRDEELFLECCSLLKSSSEVSNFSKQSARKTIPNRPIDDHEWLKTNQFYESNSNFHESNPPSNTTDFYSDASRAHSPIGDSFIGDMSNSDTLRNDWQSDNSKFKKVDSFEDISLGSMNDNTNDNILTKEDSMLHKDEVSNLSKDCFSDDFDLDSGSLKNEVTDPKIEEFAVSMKNALTSSNKIKTKKKATSEASQTSIIDYAVAIVKENVDTSDFNVLDRKVITKGARKVFEGLKVSIPTNELNMKEVLSCSPAITNINSVDSPIGKRKLSKIGNKLGLKVTKKKNKPKKKEESPTINLSLLSSDKIHDVYDFEETQDNTDLFNSNLSKFRSQGSEKTDSNVNLESSDNDEPKSTPNNTDEMPSLSNFSGSESTHSTKQKKNDPTPNNNNNKKKCMIMGRIFKNAFKSRIDLEISDIPCADNNSLVENYVMNCTNTAEIESRFDKIDRDDKKKMSQEEMDALFDKLLHEHDNVKFAKNGTTSDGNKMKPPQLKKSTPKTDKPKNGIKKRQRQNSNTSDDEFCINKTQRKKPTKKKVQDNSINLEQELKECMGVAGRKSQRKCTSGKQNVLVEYWSSDDSNFEALINPDFVRKKRDKSEKNPPNNQAQNLTETPSIEYSTSKSPAQIDPTVLAEIHKDILNATKQKAKKNGVKRKQSKTDTNGETVKVNRRKRSTGDTLYYWSSSSDDESRDLIEVKPVREEIDEDDEDRPMQHGWIVGDSPKKLVTMLAQAKGKKIDAGVCVKEQPKKRTSL